LSHNGESMKIIVLELTGAGKLSHYSFCLCNEMVKKGNEVSLITSNNYELDDLERNFSVQKTSRFYYLKLLRLIRSFKPDVIHFQYLPNPFLDLLYLKFIKLLFRLKLVYTPHNLLPHHKRPYYFTVFNKIYKLVDSIIVHSDFNHYILRDQFAVEPAKIRVIPVGNYNILFNSCINVSRDKARTKLGLDNHHKAILFFGYVRQDKGVEILLRAFKMASEKVSDLKLIIAGKPVGEVQPDILTNELGIDKDVIMDLRYIPLKKAALYFIASDVVILPYQKVCHSPLIQFAYSFGRPVIPMTFPEQFTGYSPMRAFSMKWVNMQETLLKPISPGIPLLTKS